MKKYWKKYQILFFIGIFQIIPIILNQFSWYTTRTWLQILIPVALVILIILLTEVGATKTAEQISSIEQKALTNEANIYDLSASTINISGKYENLSTLLSSYDKRIDRLEHSKPGFRGGKK